MPSIASLPAPRAPLVAAALSLAACGAPSRSNAPSPASAAAPPAAAAAAAAAGERTVVTSREVVRRPMTALRRGDIRPDSLARVAGRVAAIVAEPAELRVAVGDTIRLEEALRVAAVDSAGARVGGLAIYDFGLQPGAAVLVHDAEGRAGIAGRTPGVGTLRLHFPRYAWHGDDARRPGVDVRVTVGPEAR